MVIASCIIVGMLHGLVCIVITSCFIRFQLIPGLVTLITTLLIGGLHGVFLQWFLARRALDNGPASNAMVGQIVGGNNAEVYVVGQVPVGPSEPVAQSSLRPSVSQRVTLWDIETQSHSLTREQELERRLYQVMSGGPPKSTDMLTDFHKNASFSSFAAIAPQSQAVPDAC